MKPHIVLITGATAGIGKATATQFAQQGSNLILCARRQERLETLAHQLSSQYSIKTLPITLDIQDNNAITRCINNLPDEWQAIDVLVNNAGTAITTDKIQEANPANWDIMIDTNIKGLLYMTRAVISGMLERDKGHIINIGSIAGHEYYSGGNVYCATKHAVKAINKTLRIDLLGTPIRTTSIDPGMVHTEFSAVRWNDHEKAEQFYADSTPLQPDDIADAIVYCANAPQHVNVETMVIMPTCQASTNHLHRDGDSKNHPGGMFSEL